MILRQNGHSVCSPAQPTLCPSLSCPDLRGSTNPSCISWAPKWARSMGALSGVRGQGEKEARVFALTTSLATVLEVAPSPCRGYGSCRCEPCWAPRPSRSGGWGQQLPTVGPLFPAPTSRNSSFSTLLNLDTAETLTDTCFKVRRRQPMETITCGLQGMGAGE